MLKEGKKQIRLIEKIRNGDQNAVRDFYLDNQDFFINFCRKGLNLNREESLELYHECMAVFIENCMNGKFTQNSERPVNYLIGIARNICGKRFRNKGRVLDVANWDNFVHNSMVCDLNEPEAGEDEHLRENMIRAAQIALSEMPEPCRSLLTEFYISGNNTESLLKMFNFKNSNSLKSRKSQCLKQLRSRVLKLLRK